MTPEEVNAEIRDYVNTNGMSKPLKDLERSVDKAFSYSESESPWSYIYSL